MNRSNPRPDTLMQDPTPPDQRTFLQHTAGPYIRVKGGIALVFSDKPAFGSRSCLSAQAIQRKWVGRDSTRCGCGDIDRNVIISMHPLLCASLKSVSDDEGTTGGRSGPLRASKRVATSVTYTAHLSHLYYLAVCRRSKTRNMKRLFLERHFIWSDGNGPEPSTLAILLISFLP